jgi:hypothetical protein
MPYITNISVSVKPEVGILWKIRPGRGLRRQLPGNPRWFERHIETAITGENIIHFSDFARAPAIRDTGEAGR